LVVPARGESPWPDVSRTQLPTHPLVPVSALAVPQQQREIDPGSTHLTIREWISLLQRDQQLRQQRP
jgi:hypothetical protein